MARLSSRFYTAVGRAQEVERKRPYHADLSINSSAAETPWRGQVMEVFGN